VTTWPDCVHHACSTEHPEQRAWSMKFNGFAAKAADAFKNFFAPIL
jgi:hypothetical protein